MFLSFLFKPFEGVPIVSSLLMDCLGKMRDPFLRAF